MALLEISAHVATCCFCTAKIDSLEDTLRCKTKYLDRMVPWIWLVFHLKWFFNLYTMITTDTVHYQWGLAGEATLKLHHPLYTWCTMVRSLWHVEWNIWNILVQTACLYTSCKWGKRVLKMILCIPSEDGSIRDFCTRSYLLLVYS